MFLARGRICEAPNFSQPTRPLFSNMHRKLREDSKLETVVIVRRRRHKSKNTIYSDGQLGRGLVPSLSLKCQQHGD